MAYSIHWARNVVKAHYSQYARASYLILTSSHFTTENLARWLSKSQEDAVLRARWTFYKFLCEKLAEELDKRLPPGTKQVFSKHTRSILSEVFWTFELWGPDWLLTEHRWWAEHEEQFLKAPRVARRSHAAKENTPEEFNFGPT